MYFHISKGRFLSISWKYITLTYFHLIFQSLTSALLITNFAVDFRAEFCFSSRLLVVFFPARPCHQLAFGSHTLKATWSLPPLYTIPRSFLPASGLLYVHASPRVPGELGTRKAPDFPTAPTLGWQVAGSWDEGRSHLDHCQSDKTVKHLPSTIMVTPLLFLVFKSS